MRQDALEALKLAFRSLPGIGPRSASRIVSQLLRSEREDAMELSRALSEALEAVRPCECCGRLTEGSLCAICADPRRDASKLCVVESDEDLEMMEQTRSYAGRYFVLGGLIDPVQATGPEELGFEKLIGAALEERVGEVILATPFTPQGDATAHFLARLIKARRPSLHITRLSRGIPAGIELEYTDANTLANAVLARKETP